VSLDPEVGGLPDLLPLIAEDLRWSSMLLRRDPGLAALPVTAPGHRDRNRHAGGQRQEIGSALLDPGAALSLADSLLAAAGSALSYRNTDRVMAEILEGVDMGAVPAELLDGGE
jgi:hypothetical protein